MGEYTFLIVCIAVTIIITLLIRELVMWYWKINKLIESLDKIHDMLHLSLYDKLDENIVVTNIVTKKQNSITIRDYLSNPNKKHIKIS